VKLQTATLETPLGAMTLVVKDDQLALLDFADNAARIHKLLEKRFADYTLEPASLPAFSSAVSAYFAGELSLIHTLPVDSGGTAFQQSVWGALKEIPIGQTWSYLELARAIDHPSAVRAVGMTNGLNPISLALPCHRVIGANGSLTGYAGGLERKKWLLEHETKFAGSSLFGTAQVHRA
jgi:methylated-DNA-[protein]-cysteine S-methyltransferase